MQITSYKTIGKELSRFSLMAQAAGYWIMQGLGTLLPISWTRRFSARDWNVVVKASDDATEHLIVRKHLFACDEKIEIAALEPEYPLVDIELPADQVVYDNLIVPKRASRTLGKMLKLRILEYSPFPAGETSFAWQSPFLHNDKLHVPVAMVRSSVLLRAKQRAPESRLRRRVLASGSNPRESRFFFEVDYKPFSVACTKSLILWSLALISVVAGLMSVPVRIERSVDGLVDHQRELISHIRAASETQSYYEQSHAVAVQVANQARLPDLLKSFGEMVAEVPEGVRLSQVAVACASVAMQAYAPEDALKNWPEGNQAYRVQSSSATDYPGFSLLAVERVDAEVGC